MQEFPAIQKVHQEYAGNGLTVLAITSDDDASIRRVRAAKKATFGILKDADDKVSELYKVTGIPRTLIIDKDGVVQADFLGGRGFEAFKEALKKVGL